MQLYLSRLPSSQGANKIYAVTHSYFYWPNISNDSYKKSLFTITSMKRIPINKHLSGTSTFFKVDESICTVLPVGLISSSPAFPELAFVSIRKHLATQRQDVDIMRFANAQLWKDGKKTSKTRTARLFSLNAYRFENIVSKLSRMRFKEGTDGWIAYNVTKLLMHSFLLLLAKFCKILHSIDVMSVCIYARMHICPIVATRKWQNFVCVIY